MRRRQHAYLWTSATFPKYYAVLHNTGTSNTGLVAIHAVHIPRTTKILIMNRIQPNGRK